MSPAQPQLSYLPADVSADVIETTLGDLLRGAVADAPDAPALIAGRADPAARRCWTYAELLAEAERVAYYLLETVEPGERVALWAPSVPEWVFVEFGAALAGVTLVAINPALREPEARALIGHSGAALLIHGERHRDNELAHIAPRISAELPAVREAISLTELEARAAVTAARPLPTVDPRGPVQIQFTSGTSGRPKGVILTHRGMANSTRFSFARAGVPERSHYVNPMPMFHTSGCGTGTLGPIWARGCHVLVREFQPGLVLELLEAYAAPGFGCVPTMLHRMLDHEGRGQRDLSALSVVLTGGAMVPAPLIERVESEFGCDVSILYGMTEFGSTVTQTQPGDPPADKTRTVGRPLPQMEVKVAHPETGEPLPIGTAGEFCARGYQVMLGYYDDEEATAAAIDADGWMRSGDLCTLDERGYVSVVGRIKDVIIRGGENIAAGEIEEHLLRHGLVADVAVVGVADEEWGEVVAAVVVPAEGEFGAAELRDHCRDGLARHKVPRQWFRVESFPMTASGKVQKYQLREAIRAGRLDSVEL